MEDLDEVIAEINVAVVVNGEVKRLNFPVSYDCDEQEIMRLLQDVILPLGALPGVPEDEGDEEWPDNVAGEMDWNTFDDRRSRGADLLEIDCASSRSYWRANAAAKLAAALMAERYIPCGFAFHCGR